MNLPRDISHATSPQKLYDIRSMFRFARDIEFLDGGPFIMQPVVVDKPYRFYPPYQGRVWPWIMQRFVRRMLDRSYGIVGVECRGIDRLRDSRAKGHGILLAPNHCRPCDPFVVNEVCRQAGTAPLIMASWHL